MDPSFTPPTGNVTIASRPSEEPLRARSLPLWLTFAAILIVGAVFYFLYSTRVGALLSPTK